MLLRAFWLLFLIGCSSSYAGLFDDEEARKQIAAQQVSDWRSAQSGQTLEARIVKLEEVLNNQPLLELHNQIESLRLDLNKLQGQIEVLVNENELTQKRQKDFYIDLDSRLRRIEQPKPPLPLSPASSTATCLMPRRSRMQKRRPRRRWGSPLIASAVPAETARAGYETAYSSIQVGQIQGCYFSFQQVHQKLPGLKLSLRVPNMDR